MSFDKSVQFYTYSEHDATRNTAHVQHDTDTGRQTPHIYGHLYIHLIFPKTFFRSFYCISIKNLNKLLLLSILLYRQYVRCPQNQLI